MTGWFYITSYFKYICYFKIIPFNDFPAQKQQHLV